MLVHIIADYVQRLANIGACCRPAGTLIYHNVASRQDVEEVRQANAGERLAFARLPTGVRVIGVNAGHAFSFVRDAARELRWAAVPAEGSQFRSRDLFPQATAAIALGHPDALGDVIHSGDVPDVPEGVIAYIDGYGNLKTTLRAEGQPYSTGTAVHIRINTREHEALAGDGTFTVAQGQMALAPGSSGWTSGEGKETRWLDTVMGLRRR